MRTPSFVTALARGLLSEKTLSPPSSRGGWWNIVSEPFSGAWQRNEELSTELVLAFHAVFSCHTLICSDVAKSAVRLVAKNGLVWEPTDNPAFSPVLRKPNDYQNRIQFFENWVNSKLARGNTYVLKVRDNRQVVTKMHVLNPDLVTVLVSDGGDVFYQVRVDNISGIREDVIFPAREIMHDRFNCLFHPLVGISPLYASALAATQGTNIQRSAARLAASGVRPSGILSAPKRVSEEDAKRIKDLWENNYAGPQGAMKIAVLGDGIKFEPLTMTSEDAQLVEMLKYTAEVVCSTYHVPPYKIGVGALPAYNNVQALNVEYYSQCLQVLIESIELCLDEGLGIGEGVTTGGQTLGTEFDIENLLRMDSLGLVEMLDKGKNYFTPNEGRAKLNQKPKPGGDAVYRQQQDYSIEALNKRDSKEDPFASKAPTPPPSDGPPPDAANDDNADAEAEREAAKMLAVVAKGLFK